MGKVCNISISLGDGIKVDFCKEVEIVETIDSLTNTATVLLPKKITFIKENAQKTIDEVITVGLPITIKWGYNQNIKTEFTGYVSQSPRPTAPFVIECQDEMWLLKRKTVENKSWVNATLKNVIDHIAPEYINDCLEAQLGKFIIGIKGKETAANVLKRLNDEYGIKCFFRLNAQGAPVLVGAKPYLWGLNNNVPPLGEITYCLNGFDCNVKSNNLKYSNGDERLIKIDAQLIKPDGKKVKANFTGDSEGATHTLHYYNISESQLETFAKDDYARLKKDGFEGTVTGFNEPVTTPGMVVRVIDRLFEKKDEKYFINKVVKRFDDEGISRINTLGYKAI